MEESKKKTGFLGKVLKVLSGKPLDEDDSPSESASLNSPQREPVDLSFVKNFTASGGKFLYCEKERDAYTFLKEIAQETGISNIYCQEENFKSILNKAGFKDLADRVEASDAFASSCEYLVSFNGGIMITAKQTKGKKLSELPDIFITLAHTSQIVENLRSALTGIRNKYQGDIPSQITTIKGHEDDDDDEASSQICKKDIYLLLLEDQF